MWQTHPILNEDDIEIIEDTDMPTAYLGALGGTGLTVFWSHQNK